jgi:hypothetical protein
MWLLVYIFHLCAALSFSLLIPGHAGQNIPLVGYPLLDAADAAIMAFLK